MSITTSRRPRQIARLLGCIMLFSIPAHAQTQPTVAAECRPGSTEPSGIGSVFTATGEDERFVAHVLARMAAVTRPADMAWPPIPRVKSGPDIQAYASVEENQPSVTIYKGLLRCVVEGKEDRLAFIVGHELGHHLLGHTTDRSQPRSAFLEVTFSREQEFAADYYGMDWALKAGYTYSEAVNGAKRLRQVGGDYSSFEAMVASHPSMSERLEKLDKQQAPLWRAMTAFSAGVSLLGTEQYWLAERCFQAVTKQFPDSYDAWADLGYARLMEYADALDGSDIRRFGVGQIVVGGFYRRPRSLEGQIRGINEELWFDAVGALKNSLRLKPDLAASHANLGLAYLIRPSGSDPGTAEQYLEQAYRLAAADTTLDRQSRSALMINLAVAYAGGGDFVRFDRLMDEAQSLLTQTKTQGFATSVASNAVEYNRALRLSGSDRPDDQRSAVTHFERYLRDSSPDSAWWDLAFDRYTAVCAKLTVSPKRRAAFRSERAVRFRPVFSLAVAKGTVTLGEPIRNAQALLGAGISSPAIPNTNLMLIRYPAEGIELLANDKVLAIALTTGKYAIPIRERGLGAKTTGLRVTTSKAELDRLSDVDGVLPIYDGYKEILFPGAEYRFYSELGLAIRVHDNRIVEIVIVQMPRENRTT